MNVFEKILFEHFLKTVNFAKFISKALIYAMEMFKNLLFAHII